MKATTSKYSFIPTLLIACLGIISNSYGQAIFNASGGTDWNTIGNWSTGALPTTTIAQFAANPTSGTTGVGISTASVTTQALSITSGRSNNLLIGNSSAAVRTLTFTGGTVGGVSNVIISNQSTGPSALTMQNVQGSGSSTLSFPLGSLAANILAGPGSATSVGNVINATSLFSGNTASVTFLGGGTWNSTTGTGLNGGLLRLGAANTTGGGWTVGKSDSTSGGILQLDLATAIKNVAGNNITVNKNSQLLLALPGTYTLATLNMNLNGRGSNVDTIGPGALVARNGGAYTMSAPVNMYNDAMISVLGTSALTLSGALAQGVGSTYLTTAGTSTGIGSSLVFTGLVSGTGTDTMYGGGTWNGTTGSGVNGGLFRLNNTGNTFTAPITVGKSDGTSSGILELDFVGAIPNNAANKIYINKNSQLYLASATGTFSTTLDSLFLQGRGNNYTSTGFGALISKGGVAYTWPSPINTSNAAVITALGTTLASILNLSGNIQKSSATTFVTQGGATGTAIGATINATGIISGSGVDTFYGGGTWNASTATGNCGGVLKFGGANTSTNGIYVGKADGTANGILELDNLSAINNVSGNNITINPNSQLYLAAGTGTYTLGNVTLNLNGAGNNYVSTGAGALIGKNAVAYNYAGPINLASNATISASGTGTVTVSGNISGSSTLTKGGTGTVILSGTSNSYSNGTVLSGGVLTVNSGSSISTGSLTIYQATTGAITLNLNNTSQTISSLASNFTAVGSSQTQTLALASGHTLTINQSTSTTFGDGSGTTQKSVITGAGAVVKSGGGTLTLTSAGNTFSGGLTISGGTLKFNPSATPQTTTSNVVLSGGTLSTAGISLGSAIMNFGTLSVTANSTIDLGTAVINSVKFATNTALTWTGILSVTNWQGNYATGVSSAGKLYIGTTTGHASVSQLAHIQFIDGSGNVFEAQQITGGEIVPKMPTITTSVTSYGPFCTTTSHVISVGFTFTGNLYSNCKVQLSDATGSFAGLDTSTNIIGTGTGTTSPISATIPASTTPGNYRVRVINGLALPVYGSDNGSNIVIDPTTPSIGSIVGSSVIYTGSITLTCTPSGGAWSSSNPSVATIGSVSGTATGVSRGTCTITYTVTNTCSSGYVTSTFTVTDLPVITSISPNHAKPGDTVTVNGQYFNATAANNIVSFGATKGTVLATGSSTTALQVVVNGGATLGPVSLLNTGLNLIGSSTAFYNPVYKNSYFLYDSVNFKPKVDFAVGTTPYITAIGDLDGDGKPDMVTANYGGANLSVYLNTSSSGSITSGSFTSQTSLTTGSNPVSVKLADMDRDGKLDVICTAKGSNRVYVYRNTSSSGSITFAAGVFYSTIASTYGTSPYVVSITDIDMDGKPDIVASAIFSTYECIVVLRNTSTTGATMNAGSFASPVTFPLTSGSQCTAICAGDFDGDGRPDVAVACSTANVVSVFRNTANSGTIDASSFASPVDFGTGSTPVDVQTADIDGDSKLDLLVSNATGSTFSVLRNTGSSGSLGFATKVDFSTGSFPVGVSAGDFNGDNKIDVVVCNAGSNTVSVYRNTATSGSITSGSLSMVGNYGTGATPYGVTVGDLDVDGYPDIAVATSAGNTISIIRNYPLPKIAAIQGATAVCSAGDTTRLTDSTAGGSWSFSNGKGTIGAATGLVTGISAGLDTAYYRIVAGGDTNYVSKVLNIIALPTIAPISGSSSLCPGFTDTLRDDSTTGITVWGISNTTYATISASGVVTGVLEGLDTAIYTLTSLTTGCTNRVTLPLTITHTPVSGVVIGVMNVCTGAVTGLATTGGDAGGSWSSSNTSLATVSAVGVVTGVSAGNPIITYTVTNGCGTASDTALITVNPLANPGTITGTTTVCDAGATTALSDAAGGGSWSSSNNAIATVNGSGLVTGVTAGSATISYTVTNGCGSVSATAALTVNTIPSAPAAITGTTNVCFGGGTTNLSDATSGGTWTSSNTSLATVDATTGVVTGVTAGSPVITYTVSNTCGTNYVTTTVNVMSNATAAITSAVAPCTGHATNVIFTGSSGATVGYQVDFGTVLFATLTGGTFSLGTGAISSAHTYTLHNVSNGTCIFTIDSNVVVTPMQMQWVGGTASFQTDWNTASNWSCSVVPDVTDNVVIPSGTTYSPVISTATSGSVNNLTINSGASVTLNGTAVLNVKGNFTHNGTVTGAGLLSMDNTSAQTVSGIGNVDNFDVNNTGGVTVNTGARLTIKKILSVTSGTLATGDSVVLYSDTNGSARVAVLSGTPISGNVRVQQFMSGGRRAYRFWAHPFTSGIPLSQLVNFIDITGVGGSTNGFTTTGSNQASSYWYNPLSGNSSNSSDPGWKAFTSAYGTPDSNLMHRYQGIRVYYRGSKGEGLGYGPYIVISNTTVAQWGVLNQGSQDVPMARGANSNQDYNMVGNPYASPVDIGTVVFNAAAAGRINGSSFYIWNPFLGVAGQFQAVPYSTGGGTPVAIPYYIQANNCFQVRTLHNGDLLNFTESNKGSTITNAYSLMKSITDYVSLYVYDANYHPYDMLHVRFDDAATNNEDVKFDAGKPSGAEFNFYSLSGDNHKLSIDARPFKSGQVVPLGIGSSYAQEYIIRAENMALPTGGKLYLHDKLLNQSVLLQQGTEYRFAVTSDKNTQGENRFELTMEPQTVAGAQQNKGLQVTISPNPATDIAKITFSGDKIETVSVRVLDLSGANVYTHDCGQVQQGIVSVPLNNLPSGIYMVELTYGDQKVVTRLIKE